MQMSIISIDGRRAMDDIRADASLDDFLDYMWKKRDHAYVAKWGVPVSHTDGWPYVEVSARTAVSTVKVDRLPISIRRKASGG
jgi:hypothetical protein